MKKNLYFLGILLSNCVVFSQNTFPTGSGTNVGIGTTSPSARLEVNSGASNVSGVRLTSLTSSSTPATANGTALGVDSSGNIILVPSTGVNIYNSNGALTDTREVTLDNRDIFFVPTAADSEFTIKGATGYIGIGTKTPSSELQVDGTLQSKVAIFTNTLPNSSTFSSIGDRNDKCRVFSAGSVVGTGTGYNGARMFDFLDFPSSNIDAKSTAFFGIGDRADNTRYRFIAQTAGTTTMDMLNQSQQSVFKVYDDGSDNIFLSMPNETSYVTIGTNSYTDGGDTFKLSVNGDMRANRVKVYTSWADFVFEKDYDLPTLAEVEQHIIKNGHLKDIPSAKDVEAHGIELGEMNKKLLQKVEELTLYIIELNKKVEKLEANAKN